MATSVRPASPVRRHVGSMVAGALLAFLALGQLVPLLLSSLLMTSDPLWERVLSAVAFGLPLALLLLAGVALVRHGLGIPTAPPARPTSRTGWAAVLLGLGSVTCVAFSVVAAAVMRDSLPGESFFDPLWLAVPVLAAGGLAVGSLVTGVVAVVRRDRAPAVVVALSVAWFFVTFGLGELLFEH